MQRLKQAAALYIFASFLLSGSARAATPGSSSAATSIPISVAGNGVTAPALQPSQSPVHTGICLQQEHGEATLSAIIDTEGIARNLFFIHPLATDLDKVAIAVAEQDRFTPGSRNGVPVPVAISLKMTLQGCWTASQGSDGRKTYILGLSSQPIQQVSKPVDPAKTAVLISGNGMSKPDPVEPMDSPAKPLFDRRTAMPPLHCSSGHLRDEQLYEAHFDVDRQGMPQNVQLTKCPNAANGKVLSAAILRLRFKPAFRGGHPVVTHDAIQVKCQSQINP